MSGSPSRRFVLVWIVAIATLIAATAWSLGGTGSPVRPVPALAQSFDCSGVVTNGGFESPALSEQGLSLGNADGWSGSNFVKRDDANAHSGTQVGIAAFTLIQTLNIAGLQVGDTITISFWHDLAVAVLFEGNTITTGSNGSHVWGQDSITYTLTNTAAPPVLQFSNAGNTAYIDDVTATCTRGVSPTATITPTSTPPPPYAITITDFSCAGPLQQTSGSTWEQAFNYTVQIVPPLRAGDSLAQSAIVFSGPGGLTYAEMMPQWTESPSGVTGTRRVQFSGSAPVGPAPFHISDQVWKAGIPSESDDAEAICDGLTPSPTPTGPTSTPTNTPTNTPTPTVTPTSTATLPPQNYTVTISDFSCAGPLQQTSGSSWVQTFNYTVQIVPPLQAGDSLVQSAIVFVGGGHSYGEMMPQWTESPSGVTGTRRVQFSGSAPSGAATYRISNQIWKSGIPSESADAEVTCDNLPPTATATSTSVPPTETAVSTATSTSVPPTETLVSTATSTEVPPTETAVSTATSTTVPPTETIVSTATSTTVPPTETPVSTATSTTVPPTETLVSTATSTTVPPTETLVSTATSTEVPPTETAVSTATSTEVPPTATLVSTATDVPASTATDVPASTATDVPASTATDVPASTATDVPASTATDVPASTATDVPASTATDVPASTATDVPPTSAPTEVPTGTGSAVVTLVTSSGSPIPDNTEICIDDQCQSLDAIAAAAAPSGTSATFTTVAAGSHTLSVLVGSVLVYSNTITVIDGESIAVTVVLPQAGATPIPVDPGEGPGSGPPPVTSLPSTGSGGTTSWATYLVLLGGAALISLAGGVTWRQRRRW